MRAYRTVKRQKRLVFVLRVLHTLLLQFVCDKCIRVNFAHECLRAAQTFYTKMFVYENTTFYTHAIFTHTFHTNTKHKMSSKRYRRHFVTREYFRVLATQNK